MNNSTIWWVILIIVVLLGAYFLFVNRDLVSEPSLNLPDVPEVLDPTLPGGVPAVNPALPVPGASSPSVDEPIVGDVQPPPVFLPEDDVAE
jgi:hypothetical protein